MRSALFMAWAAFAGLNDARNPVVPIPMFTTLMRHIISLHHFTDHGQPTRALPIGQGALQMLTFPIPGAKNVRERPSSLCRPAGNMTDHNS
jgi:hypothetical protein